MNRTRLFGRINVLLMAFLLFNCSLSIAQITSEEEAISVEQKNLKSAYLEQKELFPKLISYYSKTSLEKALSLSNQFIAVAKKQNDKRAIADGLNLLGRTNIRMGNFAAAKQIHIEALFAYQALAHDTGVAAQYGNLGVIFEMSGDFPKAILLYQQALTTYEKLKDTKSIAFAENNIGIVYQEMGLFSQSLGYQQRAFKHKQELNDSAGMASTLNNIGVIYESLKLDFDKALFYYKQALTIYQKIGNTLQIGTLLNNIGLIYLKQDHLADAGTYLNQGLVIRQAINDKSGEASSLLNLAQLALKQNRPADAIDKASTSISLFLTMGLKTKLSEAYQTLAEGYEKTNKQGLALENYKKHIAYRDSVYNENNQKTIHEMQAKYDNEVSQKQLVILEKENELKTKKLNTNRWIFVNILIVFLLIATAVIYYFRQYRLKQKQRLQIIQHQLFRSQMNPHFVFNALSSLQMLVLDNKPEMSASYITRFGKLMRKILVNSNKELVALSDEIETLTDYVVFQKLRFDDKFEFKIELTPELEVDFIAIPPMIIQPFIENAIEHAFVNTPKGLITLKISSKEPYLILNICDNGVGIQTSETNKNPDHQSMAIDIVRKRLKILSKNSKKPSSITIIDRSEIDKATTGTVIELIMPLMFL